MDRRTILGLVAVVAVLSAAVGWVAGQQIKSPAQIAAESQPPPPSLITVPIEFRTLSQDVVVRGTISPSDETDLVAPAIDGASVVTRLPKTQGDLIEEGDVVVEIAGRPVIALQGALPAFRNFIPGLKGPDVVQLEEALVRLGYDPGEVDDTYTAATGEAVRKLYLDLGYNAREPDEVVRATFESAEDLVDSQEAILADAQQALADAQEPVTDLERRQLDLAIANARAELEAAKAGATDADASAAVAEAERVRSEAAAAADAAASRLQQARDGTHPDTGTTPTEAELAELETASNDAVAARTQAENALTAARAAGGRSETEQALLVTAAELAVAEAEQAKTDRLNPPDLTRLRTAVTDARSALTEAREDLSEASGEIGAPFPTEEILFLSALPRQVNDLFVELGDTPTDSVMTISGAETVIESGVSTADRPLIEVGTEAILEDDDLGISIPAIVTFVADNAGGPGLSADRYAMRLEAVDEVPEDAIGLNLRIAIPITSSGGDVLAVPLAALSAGPDGTARVEVERAEGTSEIIEVSAGLRAEGFVQIESLGEELEVGDRVVVGRDVVLPGADGADDDGADDDGDADDGDADEDEAPASDSETDEEE